MTAPGDVVVALLRTRSYLVLLVLAGILGGAGRGRRLLVSLPGR